MLAEILSACCAGSEAEQPQLPGKMALAPNELHAEAGSAAAPTAAEATGLLDGSARAAAPAAIDAGVRVVTTASMADHQLRHAHRHASLDLLNSCSLQAGTRT